MSFLKDLISSLYNHVDTRINNPVLGTFSAIFFIVNWHQFTILIFGSDKIESRVEKFKFFIENISLNQILYIAFLTLLYLLILPLINHAIGFTQGLIEHKRYTSNISQEVKNESERGRLINSRYKAEHQNEIAAQEILEEISLSNERINQQKILTERLNDSYKSAKTIIQSMYEKSQLIKAELDKTLLEKETYSQKLSRENYIKEREKLSYERLKLQVEEKRKISQLTLSYYLINELHQSFIAHSIIISFSGLGSIIAGLFGYTSFSKLLEDESFNSESLESVKYIIYSESFISQITSILESEKLSSSVDSYTVFENLESIFNSNFGIRILTEEETGEKIQETLEEGNELYDLTNYDEVSSSMAETNAFFDSVENLQIITSSLEENYFDVEFECVLTGTTHEDKPFCGDKINISFISRSEVILGKNALGDSTIEEVNSSVKDYYEDDDYSEHSTDDSLSQQEFEF
ncbi:hypothetical protein [Aeromonas veronii]|uniref:hypothetical protein n=1 Tax=Aeromonas veronii TaxID=654 RepID=UPI00191F9767|nr:hypothetical protein [Aeromonas veronii]MBL0590102.1 hypothetical protein [Aeromonas veronii]